MFHWPPEESVGGQFSGWDWGEENLIDVFFLSPLKTSACRYVFVDEPLKSAAQKVRKLTISNGY